MIVSESSEVVALGTSSRARFRFVFSPSAHWLDSSEDVRWDGFVAEHRYGLVYHVSAWKRVLETAFPHIRGRFLVLRDNDGRIQAGMPVYTVRSWLLGNRISSLPFSSFCDPLINSTGQFHLLLPELERERRRSRSGIIEVRATKTVPCLEGKAVQPSSTYKHHYLSLERNLDEIFQGFANSSIRQKIRQAERAGVVVEEHTDEDGLRICHSILASTRTRHSLPVLPFSFFQAMGQWLRPQHLKVFLAYQGGKPVAFHLILRFRNMWISEYSGNTDEALNGVNQILYWDSIQRAHADGATTFSFGRTSSSNEGLLSYKRRWAPEEEDTVEFTLAPRTGSEKWARRKPREQSQSYTLMRRILAKAPRPVSRLIGNYCYRHLG